MKPKFDMPIDLATHQFDVHNTWVVIGLPDNPAQHDASLRAGGFGVQLSWLAYAEPVVFVDRKFEPGHPLHGARKIDPEISPTGDRVYRADLYPCYSVRRQQLLVLQKLGLRLTLGATSENFLAAANEAFACGGLLSVLTHFDIHRGFEFTDGFLAVDELPARRRSSGSGLLDAVTCDVGNVLRRVKRSLGTSIWAVGPTRKIGAAAALTHRAAFWASILQEPETFSEHLRRADAELSNALMRPGGNMRHTSSDSIGGQDDREG